MSVNVNEKYVCSNKKNMSIFIWGSVMKTYTIKTLDRKDFSDVPKAVIDQQPWGGSYAPDCFAKMIYVRNEGFYTRLYAKERAPRSTYQNFGDPVCKDSCLEIFVNFDPAAGELYISCEANSLGTVECSVGTSRYDRIAIDEKTGTVPTIDTGRDGEYWWVENFLSLDLLCKVFGGINTESGAEYRGNYYKCGDCTEVEHYLTWAPIDLPEPDFHCPGFFGKLVMG